VPARCSRCDRSASRRNCGRAAAARLPDLGLAPSFLLVAAYPLALAALGFYLPVERRRLRRLVPLLR